jgi:hypothetical protein
MAKFSYSGVGCELLSFLDCCYCGTSVLGIDERRVAHGKGTLWAVLRGKKTGKVQVNAGTGLVLTKRVDHAEEIKEVESKVDITQSILSM